MSKTISITEQILLEISFIIIIIIITIIINKYYLSIMPI